MRSIGVLPFFIWSFGASASNQANPPDPASSIVASHINFALPGGSPDSIRNGGPWHWWPRPGKGHDWGHNPNKPGHCVQIQHSFSRNTNGPGSESAKRADAVKQAYVLAWNDYATHAFGNDSYKPVAKIGSNGSGGWGLIIIDGVDTAITMGLKDIAAKQLEWIAAQDFTTSTDPMVDGFDTTIRLIGGLLSAYDLITSGLVPYAGQYNKAHVKALLKGAKDLADLISPLFDTTTGLPYYWLNTTTHKGFPGYSNTAVDGTIILEYHRLSDLTGDDKYRNMADKAESYLINPQPTPVYPGLVGSNVDMDTGKFTNENAGWQSGVDSFFEYLIKSYVYDPSQALAKQYRDFWVTAVESTEKHLAVHPYGHPELTFITVLNNTGAPLWEMDDYSCFAGGNFLLGGAYLGRPDFTELGLAVTDSCHALYNSTVSGLNPLSIGWYGPDNTASEAEYNGNGSTAVAAREYFDKNGYFIRKDAYGTLYTLYPEPIESMMYAWRITGDPKWQEYNWEVFQSIQNDAHRGDVAVSSLWDVTAPRGGDQFDDVPR